jgi:ABC-2 type transport system permease protein
MKLEKNIRSTLGMAKADLISTFRNKASIFFGVIFPIIFIAIFGFIGEGNITYKLAIAPDSSTDNLVIESIENVDYIEIIENLSREEIEERLNKGQIAAAITVEESISTESSYPPVPSYSVKLLTSTADPQAGGVVISTVQAITSELNYSLSGIENPPITLETDVISGREYKQIDFILPGQLGFALMNTGIFGTAFLFIRLRETLVLKRFSATPVKKGSILGGLGLSKLLFAVVQAAIIIISGWALFGFTLVNGVQTFGAMIILSILGLAVFLGFGLIISSVSKDESGASTLANLITIPQFLLAGTFFPIEAFPEWLQPLSKLLPLTYLNNALRSVAYDGTPIYELGADLLALFVWIIIVYIIAVRVFKWSNN